MAHGFERERNEEEHVEKKGKTKKMGKTHDQAASRLKAACSRVWDSTQAASRLGQAAIFALRLFLIDFKIISRSRTLSKVILMHESI